jgi:hypothetical protein
LGTALLNVANENLEAVKLIINNENFNIRTLVTPMRDMGFTVISISSVNHEIYMYLLNLIETSNKFTAEDMIYVRNNMFKSFTIEYKDTENKSRTYSIFDSLIGHDDSYDTLCETIKFIERNNMRQMALPEMKRVQLNYWGKKTFLLSKNYIKNPSATYQKIMNNTYDHNYEPSYFSDFPLEVGKKLFNFYIKGDRGN